MIYKKDDLIIRSVEEKDLSTLLTLIKELAEYERLSNLVIATESSLREAFFGKQKIAEALIAEYKTETAGMAIYFHNFSTFIGRAGIYLEDLFVRPHLRGKNIGKQILLKLIQIVHERNCGRIEWAVLDWNTPAIEFYKKIGAEPMDEWTVFRLTEDKINELAAKQF